jgi:aerobic carbon-monoxide dehydrogenase small subunit
MSEIEITVNGTSRPLQLEPRLSLADCLRETLSLTSVHLGCEHGACGACTVLLDGKAVRACLSLAVMCEGRAVTTLEGLRDDPRMAVLRRTFHENHALQCGYCTPGMLMMAHDLLGRSPQPNEAAVREAMAGHLCRCTGYAGIVRAIVAAAALLQGEEEQATSSIGS